MPGLSKDCPVQRVQWGFTMQRPAPPNIAGLSNRVEVNIQNVNAAHHEFRSVETVEGGYFYCIYCLMEVQLPGDKEEWGNVIAAPAQGNGKIT